MKKRNYMNTLKNKKYKYVIKLSENTLAASKDLVITDNSNFDEYRLFKNEYLDIELYELTPLISKPLF